MSEEMRYYDRCMVNGLWKIIIWISDIKTETLGNGKESEKVSRQQKWYLQRLSGLKEYDMLKVLEEGTYG